ncbi:MAG: hypothetical protein HYT36_01260 [Candidatus Staskawiczbacteria bacterium]|nr:hypothetical protein [Candidatus Staskawiczbacteria bacterium]
MEEELIEIKKVIFEAKNICLIPQGDNKESIACALAFFYILKELGKNVNLLADEFPERLKFLIPSLDFISLPKNFVISIPNEKAAISQVYYEKDSDNLKIHLTLDGSFPLKKEDLSFYYSEEKPDLTITLGIKDFSFDLSKKLNHYGFLLDSAILNLDSSADDGSNKIFGKINLVRGVPLVEITLDLIRFLDESLVKKEAADCLMAALIIFSENFKNTKTNSEIFDIAGFLTRKGAVHQKVAEELYKIKSPLQIDFLTQIFKNLSVEENKKISCSVIDSEEFHSFGEAEAAVALEYLKTSFLNPSNMLVLWKSHGSGQRINGFFYSENNGLLKDVLKNCQADLKNNWLFFSIESQDIKQVKNQILDSIGIL